VARAIYGGVMGRATTPEQRTPPASPWALGDYHRFATEMVWGLGSVLVDACDITAGRRVLDVAAGSGNTAIRAAEAGAEVVACDITPELFEAGRREARERGVDVQWVEGDAQDLPFGDDEFDVVVSSVGAMFAPDHEATAEEMLRVCRAGGTIGMLNFRPVGTAGAFFALAGEHGPPLPDGAAPPTLWGEEAHVRALLGGRVTSLELEPRRYVERAADPHAYRAFYKETFGPIVAMYAELADEPEREQALDDGLLEFAMRENRGAPGGPAEYAFDYLVVVAHI
jgi:ubiquinone/menaquinone biosynthesis C-methylase UbiE